MVNATLFHERLLAWWIVIPLGFAIAALLAFGLYTFTRWRSLHPQLLILAFVFVLLLLGLLNFAVLEVRVTEEAFTARYGILRVRIPSEQIIGAEVTTAPLWKYWGIGIRWGLDGSIAYTTSFGAAIRIERRMGRPFVASTHRPQELKEAIGRIKRPSA